MVVLMIILWVLIVAFYIWMIFLFVRMSGDIKAVRSNIDEQIVASNSTAVSMRDVKLSILLGTQEETYKRIITSTYKSFIKRCNHDGNNRIVASYKDEDQLQSIINVANTFCNVLNYKLPEELQSMDSFLKFYNTQK